MKLIIFTILTILITTSCNGQNKEEGDFKRIESQKPYKNREPLVENEENKSNLLNKIGISTNNDKIIIEPKKTKEFFENMAKTLEKEAKVFGNKTKDITSSNLGIEKSKDKVIIDINKTKSFLEVFSKELENIAKDIENSVKQAK